MDKKIVFCGGPMGEGILKGPLRNGVAAPAQVTVNEQLPARREYLGSPYQWQPFWTRPRRCKRQTR